MKWAKLNENGERGRRRRWRRRRRSCVCNFGKKCCHTHTQSHTHIDIPCSYAVILCSLGFYAILARRFMVLHPPTLHPQIPPASRKKIHSTQRKALFPFSSGFSLPAFPLSLSRCLSYISFFLFIFLGKLFMEFILLCLPRPALSTLQSRCPVLI